jgi:hypothetical protein
MNFWGDNTNYIWLGVLRAFAVIMAFSEKSSVPISVNIQLEQPCYL